MENEAPKLLPSCTVNPEGIVSCIFANPFKFFVFRFRVTLIDSPGSIVFLDILLFISTVGFAFSSVTITSSFAVSFWATSVVGVIKFNQIPDLYTLIGLSLIIAGVLIVNLMGKTNI